MKLKKIMKRLASPVLKSRHQYVKWRSERLHVLIECIPGYSKDDWYQTFERDFVDWREHCDIRFFENFAVRDMYIQDADVLIGTWFSNEIMKCAPKLKLVQLAAAGTEFLDDLDASGNIEFATAVGLSARGVAEHALMLMLALDRRLDLAIRQQDRRQWKQDRILQGIRGLAHRVTGIIGMGNIGRNVAALLSCMQMSVVYYDNRPDVTCGVARRCASLEGLLFQSDFVVLCVPLNTTTRQMVAAKELSQMKKSAFLINVARGEVVDERALARALKQRVIAGAATDVLSTEPPSRFHHLKNCPNLIITPHVAGNIYTHRAAIRERFICNIKAFISGCPLDGSCK